MTRWTVSKPRTITLAPVREVRVRTVAGLVDVVGTDGPTRLEVSRVGGRDLTVEHVEDDGELVVGYEDLTWSDLLSWSERGGRRRTAAVSLAVPWDCTVHVGVVTADATVSGVHGPVSVRTVGGGVALVGLTGAVEATTVTGPVDTDSVAGDLTVSTVSGSLTMVSGVGGRVRADSVSGPMALDLEPFGSSDVHLSTVSGDVSVRLPHRGDLTVDVHSTGGALGSEFDGLQVHRAFGTACMSGVLGGGAGRLQVNTVRGDVALLRGAPEGKVSA